MGLSRDRLLRKRQALKNWDLPDYARVWHRPALQPELGNKNPDEMPEYQIVNAVVDLLGQAFAEHEVVQSIRHTFMVNGATAKKYLRLAYDKMQPGANETQETMKTRVLARLYTKLRMLEDLVTENLSSGRKDHLWKHIIQIEQMIAKITGVLSPV